MKIEVYYGILKTFNEKIFVSVRKIKATSSKVWNLWDAPRIKNVYRALRRCSGFIRACSWNSLIIIYLTLLSNSAPSTFYLAIRNEINKARGNVINEIQFHNSNRISLIIHFSNITHTYKYILYYFWNIV